MTPRASGGLAGIAAASATVSLALALPTLAEETRPVFTYNAYGAPGLIDMPSALMPEDADAAITVARGAGSTRTTLTFQILPRVSGSFRYSVIEDYFGPGDTLFDRSFDVRYAVREEAGGWPAITVGLQDFLGTGRLSGEYIAATGHVTPELALTGGIGWGRFGSFNGFDNPLGALSSRFDTREGADGLGGKFNIDSYFSGEAALFAGLSWRVSDRLTFSAEYSSDAYTEEVSRGLLDRDSPINLGLSYAVTPGLALTAYTLHGNEVGLQLTSTFNPKNPPAGATPDPAPPTFTPRASAASLGWPAVAPGGVEPTLRARLMGEGIGLSSYRRMGETAEVEIRNLRYRATAQAVGRTMHVLSQVMPSEVEVFAVTVSERGMPVTTVRSRRGDLEALVNTPDAAWQSYVRAEIEDPGDASQPRPTDVPRFDWALGPYLDTELFDPDDPLRFDAGLRAKGSYALSRGLFVSGSVRKRAFGTLDESTRINDSVLPPVRSDNAIYNREGDPALEYLVLEQFFRPGEAVFGRLTGGYLEKMYGGVSAEFLWKPLDSRLGIGAELNYVRQRDFDQRFGFQAYDVMTGHVSGYYDLGQGFLAQLDAGRYLAGDWGGTFTLDRTFSNGVRVGAFATLTDVSFDDFGEGSFDKGIRITLPLAWTNGRESRQSFDTTIRPVLRDGGARVSVPNRLYEVVRPVQGDALQDNWARFWR